SSTSPPHPRDPPSFPTRRSSDLKPDVPEEQPAWAIVPARSQPPGEHSEHGQVPQRLVKEGRVEALHGLVGERTMLGRDVEPPRRSEEHTSELQSLTNLVCRLLLE